MQVSNGQCRDCRLDRCLHDDFPVKISLDYCNRIMSIRETLEHNSVKSRINKIIDTLTDELLENWEVLEVKRRNTVGGIHLFIETDVFGR